MLSLSISSKKSEHVSSILHQSSSVQIHPVEARSSITSERTANDGRRRSSRKAGSGIGSAGTGFNGGVAPSLSDLPEDKEHQGSGRAKGWRQDLEQPEQDPVSQLTMDRSSEGGSSLSEFKSLSSSSLKKAEQEKHAVYHSTTPHMTKR
jgi:hypothetical protein